MALLKVRPVVGARRQPRAPTNDVEASARDGGVLPTSRCRGAAVTPADRLAEIRARAEAADEGPWYISDLDVAWEDHKPIVARLDASVITRHLPSHPPTRTSNNAEFLVHCVEDVPYLLERVAALEKVAEAARFEHPYYRDRHTTLECALDALEKP